MTIPPSDLLKKLKPTAKFAVDRESILELARIAVREGEAAFADRWEAATTPKSRSSKSKSTQPVDPSVASADATLKEFAKSRSVRSAECAKAFVGFVRGRSAHNAEPTKAALGSIPAAAKWVHAKIKDKPVDLYAVEFVDRFAGETDYTYQ